jgi:hypothetical protein
VAATYALGRASVPAWWRLFPTLLAALLPLSPRHAPCSTTTSVHAQVQVQVQVQVQQDHQGAGPHKEPSLRRHMRMLMYVHADAPAADSHRR